MHIVHILLKLAYPFKAKKFEDWRYFKVIYVAEIISVILLGCLPFAIISLMEGFTMIQFPAFTCQPNDITMTFYAFTLPGIIIQMTGTSATIALAVVLYNVS